MLHTIENGKLALTVSEMGAELWDLRWKACPEEPLLWDGKPEVWPRRAPLCFPWCGAVGEGWFEEEGNRFSGGRHGFLRDQRLVLSSHSSDSIGFDLGWRKDETIWPWSFRFQVTHTLEENQVITTCAATNQDTRPMPVQMGFHTGFRCPFVKDTRIADYLVRLEQEEPSLGSRLLPLWELSFEEGSIHFHNLQSRWIQLEERSSGRAVRLNIEGYPYLLLWSNPGIPGFFCIEPWTGMPDQGADLWKRPGAKAIAPQQTMVWTQRLTMIGFESE